MHQAGLGQRPVQQHPGGAVVQQRGHGAQALGVQGVGEPGGVFVQFGVGQLKAALGEGGALR